MSFPLPTPRKAGLAAVTAFGIASLGSLPLAAAHPGAAHQPHPAPAPAPVDEYDEDDGAYWGEPDPAPSYDLDEDGVLEHVEIDYRHYDGDRDGVLGPGERTAYWKHMFDMGKFGTDFSPSDKIRLARIAFLFDRDGDGRLTQSERVAISRLIRARRIFTRLDRNEDESVTRREARLVSGRGYRDRHYRDDGYDQPGPNYFSWVPFRRGGRFRADNWIASRFDLLDRNDNGRVSWNEVESQILFSLRRGGRP
jgi:hypothetical protein